MMKKQAFLRELRSHLSALPRREIEESLSFYSEAIDDRIEEGLSEAEAVAGMGTPYEAAARITEELREERKKAGVPRFEYRMNPKMLILLVLGSPIWISLIVAAFAVAFSLFSVLWAVVASICSVFISFVSATPAGILLSVYHLVQGNIAVAGVLFSATLVVAGLAILTFYGCRAVTVGCASLTRKAISAARSKKEAYYEKK